MSAGRRRRARGKTISIPYDALDKWGDVKDYAITCTGEAHKMPTLAEMAAMVPLLDAIGDKIQAANFMPFDTEDGGRAVAAFVSPKVWEWKPGDPPAICLLVEQPATGESR